MTGSDSFPLVKTLFDLGDLDARAFSFKGAFGKQVK